MYVKAGSGKQHRVLLQLYTCAPRSCGISVPRQITATDLSKALKLEGDNAPAQLQELYQALRSGGRAFLAGVVEELGWLRVWRICHSCSEPARPFWSGQRSR